MNSTDHTKARRRLGVVSFLNAKPLIAGLERDETVKLIFAVPSKLPAMLDAGDIDVGLVPVIDIGQRPDRWRIVSNACIGCDGETLTVRVFSRVPAEKVRRLHVDGDSHTSVALARIIWREMYGTDLGVEPYCGEADGRGRPSHCVPAGGDAPRTLTPALSLGEREQPSAGGDAPRTLTPALSLGEREQSSAGGDACSSGTSDACEAVLLIGDKVVNHGLIGYDVQTDLGLAWKSLTSLPFVFAAWAAPVEAELGDLASRLESARDRGVAAGKMIAADFGPGMGWPVRLAERYLGARLRFTIGPRYVEAMDRFFDLARKHDVLLRTGTEARPTGVVTGTEARSTGVVTGTEALPTGVVTGTEARPTGAATGTEARSTAEETALR